MTAYAYALAEIGFCLGVGRGESMVGTQYCFGLGGRPLSQIVWLKHKQAACNGLQAACFH